MNGIVVLIVLGVFTLGLLGLVLCMVSFGWFVTHPKETGESLLRGKRGRMFALSIVAIIFVGVGGLPFAGLLL